MNTFKLVAYVLTLVALGLSMSGCPSHYYRPAHYQYNHTPAPPVQHYKTTTYRYYGHWGTQQPRVRHDKVYKHNNRQHHHHGDNMRKGHDNHRGHRQYSDSRRKDHDDKRDHRRDQRDRGQHHEGTRDRGDQRR